MNKKLIIIIFGLLLTNTSTVQSASSDTAFSKDIVCNTCNQMFKTNKDFTEHRKTHEEKGYYSCTQCARTFTEKYGLKRHTNEIHGEKASYSCRFCPKKFVRKEGLKRHTDEVHGEKASHSCNICKKEFSRKNVLNRHINEVHKKHRSYLCALCNAVFTRHYGLQRHNNAQHPEIAGLSLKRKKETPGLSQAMKSTSFKRLESTNK